MMTEIIIYLLIALIFSFTGLFIGKLLAKLNFEKEKTVVEKEKSTLEERLTLLQQSKDIIENNFIEFQKELKNNQQEKEKLISEKSTLVSELKSLELKLNENKGEVEKLNEKFTKEFENLANKILDEKSLKFTTQNQENIKNILNPLQEKIKGFEDKVEKTHKESIDYHAALRQQILGLKELNQ